MILRSIRYHQIKSHGKHTRLVCFGVFQSLLGGVVEFLPCLDYDDVKLGSIDEVCDLVNGSLVPKSPVAAEEIFSGLGWRGGSHGKKITVSVSRRQDRRSHSDTSLRQRLLHVSPEILDVLDAHRETHEAVGDAHGFAHFLGHGRVGHARGVADE